MEIQDQRIALWCRIMEVILIAGVVFLPLLSQSMLWITQHPIENFFVSPSQSLLTSPEYAIKSLIILMGDVVQSFILWQCVMIFRGIRLGDVFGLIMVRRIRNVGIGFVLIPLVVITSEGITSHFLSSETFTLMLNDLSDCLLGSGLIILSHVIALGKSLHDDNRLVI